MSTGLDVLQVIQDVDWVVGSFIANRRGDLLVYQMPAEFGEEELARTTTRLASIVRSAEVCGLSVEQCDFSFSRYQLVVSRSAAGMLCVLVEAPVSRPALSMATRIALAELPSIIELLEGEVGSADGSEGVPPSSRANPALEHFGSTAHCLD